MYVIGKPQGTLCLQWDGTNYSEMETGILSYDNNVTVTDNHDGTITVAQGPGFGVISGLGTYVVGDWFMRGRGSKISDATFTSVVLPGMQEVPSESGLSWVIVEDS